MKELKFTAYWFCLTLLCSTVVFAIINIAWGYETNLRDYAFWIMEITITIVCMPISENILKN